MKGISSNRRLNPDFDDLCEALTLYIVTTYEKGVGESIPEYLGLISAYNRWTAQFSAKTKDLA